MKCFLIGCVLTELCLYMYTINTNSIKFLSKILKFDFLIFPRLLRGQEHVFLSNVFCQLHSYRSHISGGPSFNFLPLFILFYHLSLSLSLSLSVSLSVSLSHSLSLTFKCWSLTPSFYQRTISCSSILFLHVSH